LDRVGVALGAPFPAGAAMDALAAEAEPEAEAENDLGAGGADVCAANAGGARLTRIPVDGLYCNLSGMETQCLRAISRGAEAAALARAVFGNIADCLYRIGVHAARVHGAETILFTGGVAASACLRRRLSDAKSGPAPVFGAAALCGDNAVGTALLGVEKLWP
jgi:N6-L-threonylcarbamoyladenine synthase